LKPINVLLKKFKKFKWTQEIQRAFTNIKHAITSTPILISPNFDPDFIIYYFSSEDTIVSILMKINIKGE
jgi:hypothetical protein